MTHLLTEKPDIKIIGIEVRTSNKDEMAGAGRIGSQWQRFFQEGIGNRIPNPKNPDVLYGIYTNYESDVNGEYSFILGKEVTSIDLVPEGMVTKLIPASKYAAFTSRQGAMPDIVIELWQHIWKLQPQDLGGARAYLADFEIYDARAADPQNSQVDVFLSLKSHS